MLNRCHTTMVTRDDRTERTAFRMTPTEAAMLDALAEAYEMKLSEAMRALIRDAYRARAGNVVPLRRPGR